LPVLPPLRPSLFPYTTLFRSVDVEHLRERIVLLAHLLVDAVGRLLAAGDRRGEPFDLQAVADRLHDAIHHFPPVAEDGLQRLQRSEEHTSELQSLTNIVCRLL